MDKKIKIETDLETLDLVRKAVAYYLDDLEENGMHDTDVGDYLQLDKIYNKLCDLTFDKE